MTDPSKSEGEEHHLIGSERRAYLIVTGFGRERGDRVR